MEATIGINQRIPIEAIELAIKAVLNGSYDNDYATELARMEYSGENRIKKAVNIITRLSKNNALMPFLQENQSKVMTALKYPDDKGLICISMVNTAYPFCYDVTTVLGRYFHAQKEVATTLLTSKLSATYSTNRSLPNGLCVLHTANAYRSWFHHPSSCWRVSNKTSGATDRHRYFYLSEIIPRQ